MKIKKIAIAGAHGFIGSMIVDHFRRQGIEVIPFVRKSDNRGIYWNVVEGIIEKEKLEGVDVLINLSGENIFGRWTRKKIENIRSSRINSSRLLCKAIVSLASPPSVYIGASAIGYYGDRGQEILTEGSEPGSGVLADVCKEWEDIPSHYLTSAGVRTLFCRFGVVLGNGGALAKLATPFKMGFGGILGSGKQIVSWIAIDDIINALLHILEHEEITGAVNFVSPSPVTNREFTHQLGTLYNRPTLFPIPAAMLKVLLGSGAEIFLSSAYVLPKKLTESGYSFLFPHLEDVLKKYLHIKK